MKDNDIRIGDIVKIRSNRIEYPWYIEDELKIIGFDQNSLILDKSWGFDSSSDGNKIHYSHVYVYKTIEKQRLDKLNKLNKI